jgi:protein-tyrosine-phosphatase/predicted ATP-grasp superfamily ATP-dependent carboligase
MGKVLVIGKDATSFLSVVRSLGRRGLEVHAGWCPPDEPAARSRYIAKLHDLPGYHPDGEWVRELTALMERERFDLVLPTNEHSVRPLHWHRDPIERAGRVYLLDPEVFRIAFDKERSSALARSTGVPVPDQIVATDPRDGARAAKALGWPVVLKPPSSYADRDLHRRRDVEKARDRTELDAKLERMLFENGRVLLEKNVPGRGAGVEILSDRGEILLAFQHERLHEPLQGGGSSYRRSVPLEEALLAPTRRIISALGYTGVAMVEYKRSAGAPPVFMEINARFWGSLPLAIAAGADFPSCLYEMLVEGRRTFPQTYRVGLYARNTLGDLKWMTANFAADHRDPDLATRPWTSVVSELVHPLLAKEVNDTLVRDDPAPAIAEIERRLEGLSAGIRDRVSARVARSNGAGSERALRACRSADAWLFVCKGNICRSPFAEAYARRILGADVRVASAGFYPVRGRACPKEAVAAARRHGVELEGHHSTRIEPALLRKAGVVITFDEAIHRTVARAFPWAEWKLVRISALATDAPAEIEDPYGRPLDAFERCYALISRILEGAVRW